MHTGPMPDSAGVFEEWKESITPCRTCGGKVRYRVWESSCGGYEDYNFHCEGCNKDWWIDGSDS